MHNDDAMMIDTDIASNDSPESARAAANRRNAQLSTGPVTPEGKARSAQNARTTGWFARDHRVPSGQEELYFDFEHAWREELAPEGLLQLEAFHDFIRAAWRKREIIAAQNEATTASTAKGSAFLDESLARQLDRLHRYERDFERRAARHLAELRRLKKAAEAPVQERSQSAPAAEPVAAPPPPSSLPPGLPDEVTATLRIMQIETAFWNSQLRAKKAGLFPSDSPPPSVAFEA